MTRENLNDFLSIFCCQNFKLLNIFKLNTYDAESIVWSRPEELLIILDSVLACNLSVYSIYGDLVKFFQPYHPINFGITGFAPEKLNQCPFLALGYGDRKIRIMDCVNWKVACILDHTSPLPICKIFNIYREMKLESTHSSKSLSDNDSLVINKEVYMGTAGLEYQQIDLDNLMKLDNMDNAEKKRKFKNIVKYSDEVYFFELPSVNDKIVEECDQPLGISVFAWSYDHKYLASKCEKYPTALWIWDVLNSQLACLLVHKKPVKCFKWIPSAEPALILSTGTDSLYFWSSKKLATINIPINRSTQCRKVESFVDFDMNSLGTCILLKNSIKCSLAFFQVEDINGGKDSLI